MNLGHCQALLIGCGASKQSHPVRAAELYTSSYFQEKVKFAEALGKPWAILSGKLGIVEPDTLTEPYNVNAEALDEYEKREWVIGVVAALFAWHRHVTHLAIIAGKNYYDPLAATLATVGVETFNPCAGLGIGEQIAWMRAADPASTTWLTRPYTRIEGQWFDEWGDPISNPSKKEMLNNKVA